MDTNGLVTRRIEDGRKFINLLSARGFDVAAACWVRTSEDSVWILYISSPRVDGWKLADAYREAYGILQTLEGSMISASEVKLIGEKNPITTEILEVSRRYPDTFVDSSILRRTGSVMIEEAYIYGPTQTLRQEYSVRYVRQGQTNKWKSTAERGSMLKEVKAKGAVAYTSGRWEGQTPDAEKFALVSVLLELDPRCDDRSPGVWQVLTHQAGLAADEMFRSRHPEALIEHANGDHD